MAGRTNRASSHPPVPQTPVRHFHSRESSFGWSLRTLSPISLLTIDSPSFWNTPPKQTGWKIARWRIWSGRGDALPAMMAQSTLPHKADSLHRLMRSAWIRVAICMVALLTTVTLLSVCMPQDRRQQEFFDTYKPSVPMLQPSDKRSTNPIRWLQENSNDKHAMSGSSFRHLKNTAFGGRPRAAIISLVRNTELEGMMQSMRQLEYRWNHKYQYPWIFFNDEPFTEEFRFAIGNLTSAECHFAVIPKEHWSLPEWIDEDRFLNGLEYLGSIGVGKGWMASYHHMCRWNSGFFYKHRILKDFDWYWRIEPDVHFLCDIDYDVFRFMHDNDMKYGFNMNILDDARSFPSLWAHTRGFISTHPHLVHPQSDLRWLFDSQNSKEYNNCQFFSNFEIGSLAFWRSAQAEAYFNHLDKAGGFYYERFGDAPVHTLSVAMFVPKSEVWFFRDIGYQHDINRQCPAGLERKCACEPTRLDENFYKLVPSQSPQRKPDDTCIRQWLGGRWLVKKEGWSMEGEKAFGGDGYGGYVVD